MSYRAPLNFQQLDELIKSKGVWLDWVKTQRCPCISDEGVPSSLDPNCEGTGWIKTETKRIKALWTSHNAPRSREPHGVVDHDTRQLTPPRGVRLAEGDWVVMKQFPVRTSDILVHGATAPRDARLRALFPARLLSVMSLRQGVPHTFPQDAFSLGPMGTLIWASVDVEPEPGEKISVEYEHYEAYEVVRGPKPMQRGTEDQRLPDRATVKLVTRRSYALGLDNGWRQDSAERRFYP